MIWLCVEWYKYLASSSNLVNLLCRIRGHPEGVVFYTMDRLEPNYCCKTCGEDLG
jgi:hypothetical protein